MGAALLRGMFRVQIAEDGQIVGDSGTRDNLVTARGMLNLMTGLQTGSIDPWIYLQIGTGGNVAWTDEGLPGFQGSRETYTTYSDTLGSDEQTNVTGNNVLQYRHTFWSSNSFLTAAKTIDNIGLFDSASGNSHFMAGNTYASSVCATNQDVYVSYTINLSQTATS